MCFINLSIFIKVVLIKQFNLRTVCDVNVEYHSFYYIIFVNLKVFDGTVYLLPLKCITFHWYYNQCWKLMGTIWMQQL